MVWSSGSKMVQEDWKLQYGLVWDCSLTLLKRWIYMLYVHCGVDTFIVRCNTIIYTGMSVCIVSYKYCIVSLLTKWLLLSLVYISRTAALRSLAIGIARNLQEIVRHSYEFATPYDLSQRHTEEFDMSICLAICLQCFEFARIRTAAVWTTYEFTMSSGLDNCQ